jgi:hypothetical protein
MVKYYHIKYNPGVNFFSINNVIYYESDSFLDGESKCGMYREYYGASHILHIFLSASKTKNEVYIWFENLLDRMCNKKTLIDTTLVPPSITAKDGFEAVFSSIEVGELQKEDYQLLKCYESVAISARLLVNYSFNEQKSLKNIALMLVDHYLREIGIDVEDLLGEFEVGLYRNLLENKLEGFSYKLELTPSEKKLFLEIVNILGNKAEPALAKKLLNTVGFNDVEIDYARHLLKVVEICS